MTNTPKQRLQRKKSKTFLVNTGCGNMRGIIEEESGKIVGVMFQPEKKNGGCMTSGLEAFGRLITIAIRAGCTIEPLINTMEHIGCSSPLHGGAKSCADAVSIALKSHIKDRKECQTKKT